MMRSGDTNREEVTYGKLDFEGGQYFEQNEMYVMKRWDTFEELIKALSVIPAHMALPLIEALQTHIKERGATFMRQKIIEDEKFGEKICALLVAMVEMNKTTAMFAQVLTIFDALRLDNMPLIELIEKDLNEILEDRDMLDK